MMKVERIKLYLGEDLLWEVMEVTIRVEEELNLKSK